MTDIHVRHLGCVDYEPTWRAMQRFTEQRTPDTPDEIWLLEHPPVFTLGLAGRPEHLLRDIGVPVVRVDRGGQVTYHGLSLNVRMDLAPFAAINPCGYAGLAVTQLADHVPNCDIDAVSEELLRTLDVNLR